MMQHLPATNTRSATSLQFSLRGLLLATMVVALFCAFLAPVLRPWAGGQRVTFSLFLSGTLLVDALILSALCWRRRRIERTAGPLLLRAESPWGERARAAFSFGIVVVFLALMVMWSLLFTRTLARHDMSILIPLGGAAATLAIIPPATFFVWIGVGAWNLELRSEGIIHHGLQYLPWRATVQFRWTGGERPRLRVGTHESDHLLDVPLPQRKDAEKILVERTGRLVRPAKMM